MDALVFPGAQDGKWSLIHQEYSLKLTSLDMGSNMRMFTNGQFFSRSNKKQTDSLSFHTMKIIAFNRSRINSRPPGLRDFWRSWTFFFIPKIVEECSNHGLLKMPCRESKKGRPSGRAIHCSQSHGLFVIITWNYSHDSTFHDLSSCRFFIFTSSLSKYFLHYIVFNEFIYM